MKSLDKKKTKKLDWEKEFDNLNWNTDKGIMTKAKVIKQSTGETVGQITIPVTKEMVKTFIKTLLTQQRTELLDEIKDLQTYVLFNDTEKLISLEKVESLLNKKDE